MEGKLSNHSIRNGELEKKVEILTRREEEADATDKLLHDANKDLKGYVWIYLKYPFLTGSLTSLS